MKEMKERSRSAGDLRADAVAQGISPPSSEFTPPPVTPTTSPSTAIAPQSIPQSNPAESSSGAIPPPMPILLQQSIPPIAPIPPSDSLYSQMEGKNAASKVEPPEGLPIPLPRLLLHAASANGAGASVTSLPFAAPPQPPPPPPLPPPPLPPPPLPPPGKKDVRRSRAMALIRSREERSDHPAFQVIVTPPPPPAELPEFSPPSEFPAELPEFSLPSQEFSLPSEPEPAAVAAEADRGGGNLVGGNLVGGGAMRSGGACLVLVFLTLLFGPVGLSRLICVDNWYDAVATGWTIELFLYPTLMFAIGTGKRHSVVPDESWPMSAYNNLHWIVLPYSISVGAIIFTVVMAVSVGPIPPSIPTNGVWMLIFYSLEIASVTTVVLTYLFLPHECFCCCNWDTVQRVCQFCLGEYQTPYSAIQNPSINSNE